MGMIAGFERYMWAFCAVLLFATQAGPSQAESTDDSLLPYAVIINLSSGGKSWSGYGIYLGKGLVHYCRPRCGPLVDDPTEDCGCRTESIRHASSRKVALRVPT